MIRWRRRRERPPEVGVRAKAEQLIATNDAIKKELQQLVNELRAENERAAGR